MSRSSMDYFSPSGSTRVSSNSPSSTSSSFDSTGLSTAVPFSLLGNDLQPRHNRAWAFDNGGSNTVLPYSDPLFGSPHATTQQAVGAAGRPPIVQMRNLSLSSSPGYAPSGPVTFVSSSTIVAPQPVSSSPSLIGRGWPAPLQPSPVLVDAFTSEPPAQGPSAIARPQMRAKIPPEKIRKSFPCLHSGCGMNFRKNNALVQHMRSHTGERPEVCEFCSRAFSLKCNLRRHYKTCKEKKGLGAQMPIKRDTSFSPPPLEQSPSSSASSPCSTALATSHDSPLTDLFSLPPDLWSPGLDIAPSHQPFTLSVDLNCGTLFPTQFPTTYPYPTLVQSSIDPSPVLSSYPPQHS